MSDLAWYVAYGSNVSLRRFECYLRGGCPDGASRTYTGCRSPRGPDRDVPVELPGRILFAGRSAVWSGGMAFYEPAAAGQVAARGYLLSAEQVADIVTQETRLPLGTDLGLASMAAGSGRRIQETGYDTVLRLTDIDGVPAVTITAERPPDPTRPARTYLWWICAGLRETFGWSPARIGKYLGACPGAYGTWAPEQIADLATLTAITPA